MASATCGWTGVVALLSKYILGIGTFYSKETFIALTGQTRTQSSQATQRL